MGGLSVVRAGRRLRESTFLSYEVAHAKSLLYMYQVLKRVTGPKSLLI